MAVSDAFYQELIVDVDQIIDELGTTYNIRGQNAYNPLTLEATSGTSRQVAGLIATQQFVDSVGSILFPVTETSRAWIGKKTIILKASSLPIPTEEIEVDSNWFSLSKVVPIKPADIVVAYLLDVTK